MKLIREIEENYTITQPDDTKKYLKEFMQEDREFFIVLGLDTQNKVLYRDVVSVGSLNSSLVHPREVFKKAIMSSCNSIILAHNHPSGNNEPSEEDITAHRAIIKASEILQIKVLDCLILTPKEIISFKDMV